MSSKTITLRSNTNPEKAEADINAALRWADRVIVKPNGFPRDDLAVIVRRLPDTFASHSVGGTVIITPGAGKALTVWTSNLDWANSIKGDKADVLDLISKGADVVLFQELSTGSADAHPTRLSDLFGPGWSVTQGAGERSKTGVVASADLALAGHGYAAGTPDEPGKMSARLIAYRDVKLDGRPVRSASVHFPPERWAALWPIMAAAVVAFVRSSPHPVILGGDFNAPFGGARIGALAAATGLRATGHGIDGFLYSPLLLATDALSLSNDKTASDHGFTGREFRWRKDADQ